MSDNSSVMVCFNKQGDYTKVSVSVDTRDLYMGRDTCLKPLSNVYTRWQNVVADNLSHHEQMIPTAWSLLPGVFSEICKDCGRLMVDLSVPGRNWNLLIYFSPVPDPHGMKGHLPASMGPLGSVHIPSVHHHKKTPKQSHDVKQSRHGTSDFFVATERVVPIFTVPAGEATPSTPVLEPAGSTTHSGVSSRAGHCKTLRMEVIQPCVSKAGFSSRVAQKAVAHVRKSSASLYQSKWSTFCHLCHGKFLIHARSLFTK